MSVSNCSSSRGYPQAGDQTGTEYYVCDWYNFGNGGWNYYLIYEGDKADEVNALASQYARAAANNNRIGYSQSDRYSMWEHLKTSNYNPAEITINCNADCSSSTTFIFKAVGYTLNIQKLKSLDIYLYTGNMKSAFVNAGFKAYSESKYLTSPDYIKAGGVLLNEKHHVVINLDNGSKSGDTPTPTPTPTPSTHSTLRRGDRGSEVATMQNLLISKGYNCGGYGADGVFGAGTEAGVKAYQQDHKDECVWVDGICGAKTWASLENGGGGSSTWKVKVDTPSGINVRKSPSASSERIGGVYNGEVYEATKEQNGFTYLPAKNGWCASQYLQRL